MSMWSTSGSMAMCRSASRSTNNGCGRIGTGSAPACFATWQTSTRSWNLPSWLHLTQFGSRPASSRSRGSISLALTAGGEEVSNAVPHMDRRIEIRLEPVSWTSEPVETGDAPPEHLLLLVHGILASPSDWKYAAGELKAQLGNNYLIYASNVNSYFSTLSGIDSAGKRLAEEVELVVDRTPSLTKISFLAHSLGGLFARYAIAILYRPSDSPAQTLEQQSSMVDAKSQVSQSEGSKRGTIAGLEPINFISLATPHLGVRGRQQLPFLLGLPVLEKLAVPLAPFFVGSTGRQLFLTDGKFNEPPLLLRMATNCAEGQFLSALGAFKVRTSYANVNYDHMVGWRTASIRRVSELTKPPLRSLHGYKHVVHVLDYPPVPSSGPHFEENTAKVKEAVQSSPSSKKTAAYHNILEEEMIRGLQQLSWRKVDVSFHAALWPFLAHNYIHVCYPTPLPVFSVVHRNQLKRSEFGLFSQPLLFVCLFCNTGKKTVAGKTGMVAP